MSPGDHACPRAGKGACKCFQRVTCQPSTRQSSDRLVWLTMATAPPRCGPVSLKRTGAGFTLRQLAPCGAAAEQPAIKRWRSCWKQKRRRAAGHHGALALGIESLKRKPPTVSTGDQTTKHKDEALTQIAGIVKMYAARIPPNIAPKYIEIESGRLLGMITFLRHDGRI